MLHAAKPRKEVFMIGEDGARYEEKFLERFTPRLKTGSVLSRPFFGKGIMQFVCTALRFFRSYGNMK